MSVGPRSLGIALLVVAGCGKTTAPPDASPRERAAPSADTGAAPPAASARVEPPRLGDGCQAGVDLGHGSAEALKQVASACAPDTVALSPAPAALTLEPGKPARAALRVDDASACLRVAAVSSALDADLGLELFDAHGKSVGRDTLPGPVALVPSEGPSCVREAGEYRIEVSGSGSVVLGAWRAR